jgi:hypothetical protein
MSKEQEARGEEYNIEYKNILFAHAFVTNNPKMFATLYPDEFQGHFQEEEDAWQIPQSEDEIRAMSRSIRERGLPIR